MDPIIFSFNIGSIPITLRWYGVLVMSGILVGALITSRGIKSRKEDPEYLWDALIYIVIGAIIGARLWYVANATLGGSRFYINNPLQIINTPAGGLHFYGGILFGVLAFVLYARHHRLDLWLFVDAVAPGLLLGQAFARPANFINQELYGPPTNMPWGIAIDRFHRIAPYTDMTQYPASTRFHPTFAYEIIWNVLAAFFILWLTKKLAEKYKPGTGIALWLLLEGVGRVIIEFWRPDQPRLGNLPISITTAVAILMSLAGVIMLLGRYRVLKWRIFKRWEKYYKPAKYTLAQKMEKKAKSK